MDHRARSVKNIFDIFCRVGFGEFFADANMGGLLDIVVTDGHGKGASRGLMILLKPAGILFEGLIVIDL